MEQFMKELDSSTKADTHSVRSVTFNILMQLIMNFSDFGATYYENTLGIFFIGNFTSESLNDSQIKAMQTLIKNGTEKGLLVNKPEIYNRYELESGLNRWNLFNTDGIEGKKDGI